MSQLFEKEEDDKISKTEGTYHFMAPECCDRMSIPSLKVFFSRRRQFQWQMRRHMGFRCDTILHDLQRATILGRDRIRHHTKDPQRRVRA